MQTKYYEYFCANCYQNEYREDIFFQNGLIIRNIIISKKKFIQLMKKDESSPVEVYLQVDKQIQFFQNQDDPFYLCSYFSLKCPRCNKDVGIILKATTEVYIHFREKVILFYDLIVIVEQNDIQYSNTNVNEQYFKQLQDNMEKLNTNLESYQELIERQGMVEQGLTNVTKIIQKLSKRFNQ